MDWRVGGGLLHAGLVGEYFDNTELAGEPAFTRKDPRIDFDWGTLLRPGGSIAERFQRLGADNYSVRWTGQIMARHAETYVIKVAHDDGARLFLKESTAGGWTTLIDQWDTGGTHAASVLMTANVAYDLRLEYREETGPARIRLLWSSPSTPEEVIEAATNMGMDAPHVDMTYANTYFSAGYFHEQYDYNSTDPRRDGVLERDADNWPMEGFGYNVIPGGVEYAPGTYHVRFCGRADVSTQRSGTVFQSLDGMSDYGSRLESSLLGEGYDAAANRTEALMVIPEGTVGVNVRFQDTDRDGDFGGDGLPDNDGLTDIIVQKPVEPGANVSHEPGELFDRTTKRTWELFTVNRYTDINGAKEIDPDDPSQNPDNPNRVLPSWDDRPRFGTNRASYETMVMWCNENGVDLWLGLPHRVVGDDAANDAYIRKVAQLLRYGSDASGEPYDDYQANPVFPPLNPNLHCYLEYSNEVPWNTAGQYPQSRWILDRADWEVAQDTPIGRIITFDGPATENQQRARRYIAIRVKTISDIFRSVWGDDAMPGTTRNPRVRPVLMGQYNNRNIPRDTLYFMDRYFNNADGGSHVADPHPVDHYLWSYGAASYYGSDNKIGLVPDFNWNNADLESPVLAGGGVDVAPASVPGWSFAGTAGIYRNAARTSFSGGSYTVGGEDVAVYDFLGQPNAVLYVQDDEGNRLMRRELDAGGHRGAGVFVFHIQEDRYHPLLLRAGETYHFLVEQPDGSLAPFTSNESVTIASAPVAGDGVDLGFAYDAPSGQQALFLAGNGEATIDLPLPEEGTYAINYRLAQIRDYANYESDATHSNPLDIFLVVDGEEVRITSGSRDSITPAPGAWVHGDFARKVVSYQMWGTAPFQATGNVRIRFKGTSSDPQDVVFLDHLRLCGTRAFADSTIPVSGSATGEQAADDWYAAKSEQWTYGQAFGLHAGMYEGGWYPGGDWERTPIQLYFSMKEPVARAIEADIQDFYARLGIHTQCDYTLGLAVPAYDYARPLEYSRPAAWSELQQTLPVPASNGLPPGEWTVADATWSQDANPDTGSIDARGGYFSFNFIVPDFGDYYIQVATDSPASLRVLLDGSETVLENDGGTANAAGVVTGLAPGLHSLRVQSRSADAFRLLTLSAHRLTSQPPSVDAGGDQSIRLPTGTVGLGGSVVDPDSTPVIRWSAFVVPDGATVTFDDPSRLDAVASFDRPGIYMLRLAASEGALEVSDFMTVTVEPDGANQVLNSGFEVAPIDGGSWMHSDRDADVGWHVIGGESNWIWDSANGWISARQVSWGYSMAQILRDAGLSRGWQELSLLARHEGTGNSLKVFVYGVNRDFSLPLADDRGPLVDGASVGVPLLERELADTTYGWTRFSWPVLLGSGYEYLVVLCHCRGFGESEAGWIDDIRLSGGEGSGQPYWSWSAQFAWAVQGADDLPEGNPDGDPWANVFERLFRLDPTVPDVPAIHEAREENGRFVFDVAFEPMDDVAVVFETSDDLITWDPAVPDVHSVVPMDGMERHTLHFNAGANGGRLFLRMKGVTRE